jgi:integrase
MNMLSESKATHWSALYSLVRFCEHTGKDPDKLVSERIKEQKSSDPLVRNHAEETVLAFSKKVRGAHVYASFVKSFYRANYVPVNVKIKRPPTTREGLMIPDDAKLREFVSRTASKTLKALSLFLAESGARDGSVLQLRYRHVKVDLEAGKSPCAVFFPQSVTKGNITYTGFIGSETIAALKEMWNGRTLKDDDFLFVSKSGKPLSKTTTIARLQNNAFHVGLIKSRSGLKEFSPHRFRMRAQTIMEGAGIPLNWVDLMLGHTPRGASASVYSKPTTEKLRESYAKAYPELRLFGPAIASKGVSIADVELKVSEGIMRHLHATGEIPWSPQELVETIEFKMGVTLDVAERKELFEIITETVASHGILELNLSEIAKKAKSSKVHAALLSLGNELDVKHVKETKKLKDDGNSGFKQFQNEQKSDPKAIITEKELPDYLSKGYDVQTVLPSGMILVRK